MVIDEIKEIYEEQKRGRMKAILTFMGAYIVMIGMVSVFLAVYCILMCGTIVFGLFISTLMYKPEHVVERNGICMVASVNSFLQEMVYYYEYKNFLFRGAEQIGWEDYGNGGTDPLEQDGREPKRWYFEDAGGNVIESSGEK